MLFPHFSLPRLDRTGESKERRPQNVSAAHGKFEHFSLALLGLDRSRSALDLVAAWSRSEKSGAFSRDVGLTGPPAARQSCSRERRLPPNPAVRHRRRHSAAGGPPCCSNGSIAWRALRLELTRELALSWRWCASWPGCIAATSASKVRREREPPSRSRCRSRARNCHRSMSTWRRACGLGARTHVSARPRAGRRDDAKTRRRGAAPPPSRRTTTPDGCASFCSPRARTQKRPFNESRPGPMITSPSRSRAVLLAACRRVHDASPSLFVDDNDDTHPTASVSSLVASCLERPPCHTPLACRQRQSAERALITGTHTAGLTSCSLRQSI